MPNDQWQLEHSSRLHDGKMAPLYPNMLLGKITEIENYYARVKTKFGDISFTSSL